MIKDHKEKKPDGTFPTRLVAPATNFTAAFPKAGYLGVKSIFNKHKVEYSQHAIIQASDLKEELETLKIDKDDVTTVLIDAVEMHPSVKCKLVREAVNFFARDFPEEEKKKIKNCLEMIKFGMGNTLLTFVDKHYEHGGDEEVEERGLTIGGYESAWLAVPVYGFVICFADAAIQSCNRSLPP